MKVVVVGAGYAGTLAANRLAKKVPEAEITVINPRPDFVERVRLHEQIAGTGKAATPLSEMLRDGIRSRLAAVDKIGDGSVTLDMGETLDFDYLFLAVGSTVSPLPGTVPVGTWEGAENARTALASLPAGSTVSVIGAGPTGIETAAEVAYGRPDLRVRLVGPSFAASFSEGARRRVRAGLERLKVSVLEGAVAEVLRGEGERGADKVRLQSNEQFSSDLALWAIVGSIPDLAARSGLKVDDRGRAIVDRYLRSVSDPRIFVAGDCAAVPGSRPACQTAGPQGAHAADALARMIRGRKLKPYSMGYIGTGLSLGRRDGVIQVARRDDSARRLYIAGRPAAVSKEGVTRGAKYGSRSANVAWLSGPK
ncbi:FAD-dependent oxidoreductase [Actinomadura alba]|uniref:FAD-dependent oxidoreductase n=2 Tax=Actinomadura alba TaxID=406431 RepID=A0ABR7LGI8_9ACTN|nr:FAD-dependent oxidoreductase [Actinomadura alba]